MLKFLILAFSIGCAAAITTPCHDCKAAGRGPTGICKSVTLEPCTVQPCQLKKGTNETFSVTFTADQATANLTAVVYGIIAGVPVKFPLPNSDACKNSGIKCPIVAGQTYTYTDELYISAVYPSINLVVQWSLVDQTGNSVFCIVVPATIVS